MKRLMHVDPILLKTQECVSSRSRSYEGKFAVYGATPRLDLLEFR